jgi:DNA-binding SARP family transcriptional activator
MIELRVLGSTSLDGVDASRMQSILRRPKALALLTYLLVARPRGFHRRQRLLPLFWPERPDHARHALRQALLELRRDLGPIIVTRGTDEIGVAPATVWCDAVAFDDAVAQGELARAVLLCRGELLDGISIHRASHELQYWLARERSRYRGDAARAACGLAERAAAADDWGSAVRWGQLAETTAPLDEVVLWRLLALYRDLGQPARAENLYRSFEQRLADEFSLQPSSRTQGLIDEIRGHNGLRIRAR